MTGRVVPLETDPHVAVQALLPWYATGRLDEADRALVDAHLAGCPDCRAELVAERGFQRVLPVGGAQVDVEAGWAALRGRLAGDAAPASPSALPATAPPHRLFARRPRGWNTAGTALRWGWAVPTALAAGLVAQIALRPAASPSPTVAMGEPAYHALAAASVPVATALVRLRDDASLAQLQDALRHAGGRVVDGPTATGGWVVALPRDDYTHALGVLRAQPGVTLAEALEPAGAP